MPLYSILSVGDDIIRDIFIDNAKVKLIHMQNIVTSRQQVIYESVITGFRNNLNV